MIRYNYRRSFEAQRKDMYLLTCPPNEYSNRPAYMRSLIRDFVVHTKKFTCSLIRALVVHTKTLCILGYPKCTWLRFWFDCANVQADLNLRWTYMSEGTFADVAAYISVVVNLCWYSIGKNITLFDELQLLLSSCIMENRNWNKKSQVTEVIFIPSL